MDVIAAAAMAASAVGPLAVPPLVPPGAPLVAPPVVRRGDRVALLSLSGPLAARCPARLNRAADELRRRGLHPVLDPTTRLDTGATAGDGLTRARALQRAINDPGIRAVISTVGGTGCRDLLPYLDPRLLAADPTAVVGYSDTSTLLLWLHETLGWVTFYGPAALPQFGEFDGVDDYTWQTLWTQLSARQFVELPALPLTATEILLWDEADHRARRREPAAPRIVWRPGMATGPAVAANLSTLAQDLRHGVFRELSFAGRIVFIEESDAVTWPHFVDAVDVVRRAGVLADAAGVVFGRFAQAYRQRWEAAAVRAAVAPLLDQSTGPVLAEVEFGHTDPMFTVPLGVPATIVADPHCPRIALAWHDSDPDSTP